MGRWKRSAFLGEGRYGSVVLAKNDDKVIAAKSASVDANETLKHEEVFLKELIDEPYVVRCFGTDESLEYGMKSYSLLLEHATGGDLDNLLAGVCLKKSRMDATRVAHLTKMLLTALCNIHSRGIYHCDLKPANVLVFSSAGGHPERVKIADFGQAERGLPPEKARAWANFLSSNTDDDKLDYSSEKGEVHEKHKGTLLYSSPESLTKGEYGAYTDIWSLGIIVAEMMAPGKYFFNPNQDLYDQIVHRSLRLQGRVPRNFVYGNEVVDFLEKCLARNPADRWSARRLLKHPFITETLKGTPLAGGDDRHIKVENPIEPSTDWVESHGLFTTTDEDDTFTDEELPLGMQILDGTFLCSDHSLDVTAIFRSLLHIVIQQHSAKFIVKKFYQ